MATEEEIRQLEKRLNEVNAAKSKVEYLDRQIDLAKNLSDVERIYDTSIRFNSKSEFVSRDGYNRGEQHFSITKEQSTAIFEFIKNIIVEPLIEQRKEAQKIFTEM